MNGTTETDLAPIFCNLGNTQGIYVIRQGHWPCILLNESLRIKNSPDKHFIYRALVKYHDDLPEAYKLYPLIQYYEDLPEPVEEGPQLVIIGQAMRRWSFSFYDREAVHLVG